MAIFDFFLSRNNAASTPLTYVGHKDRLFFNSATGEIRISDGTTPGGFPIPLAVASTTTSGTIKLGPGVTLDGQGRLVVDSTGLDFSFGDFYAFTNTGPSDGACLSSINQDQDINIVSNGTGSIHVIGKFDVHKTNNDVEGALQSEPIFSISADGNVRVLAPNAGGLDGAVQIVGNSTGEEVSPNQTGVVVHITGNQNMVSRNYIDGVNNYPLLVGRRYNGTATNVTNVKNGELFFRIAGQASTGTSFGTFGPCQIDWVATEDQGPNNQGGELRIRATPNGSNAFTGIVQVAAFNGTTGVTAIKFNGPLNGNVNATAVTATNITVTGNINGNLSGTTVTANSFVGTIITPAQPNITSVGTLTSLTIGPGSTTTYALKFSTGTNLTTPQSGAIEYNGTVFYATPVDQERGIVVTEQKYILDANRSLNNDLVSQSLFGAGFHATGGVRYRYQILCTITKTAGNSVSIGYGLLVNGGGALARHTYRVESTIGATATTPTPVYAMRNSVTTNFATPVDVTGPLTNGASGSTFNIQGVIEVISSGYVTPQITFLSNAPTGATLSANATIRVFPVGSTGTNTVVGNWA